ncbi:hypothetical protein SASPL_104447 [Salvia splendens]|uniref:ACT domain-containing protein n=1 Tax=Salvia splendens TaxID=180675 RepID=A0A8X8YJ90_SALSN|nr:hypothetical protein SASPL_104447 [Salvia splendens]
MGRCETETSSDDAVSIEEGKKLGDPYIITVNCLDKTGLSCDICHAILEFDLFITRGVELWLEAVLDV